MPEAKRNHRIKGPFDFGDAESSTVSARLKSRSQRDQGSLGLVFAKFICWVIGFGGGLLLLHWH